MSVFHHHTRRLPLGAERFMALFEGIEGGFAIAAGVIAGLSFGGLDKHALILTAIVSILVNGFNSASVRYSSDTYMDDVDGIKSTQPFRDYVVPSLLQFAAYIIVSLVSILPLFLVPDLNLAVLYCCVFTLVILLISGYWRASLLDGARWHEGLETAALGLGIILVGTFSGMISHSL
ncbi:MAG: VIT1/CCC1 transporter family protein [Acidobacteriota bacterium]